MYVHADARMRVFGISMHVRACVCARMACTRVHVSVCAHACIQCVCSSVHKKWSALCGFVVSCLLCVCDIMHASSVIYLILSTWCIYTV